MPWINILCTTRISFFRIRPRRRWSIRKIKTSLLRHLPCAAAEHPLYTNEALVGSSASQNAIKQLEATGDLLRSADGTRLFSKRKRPHRTVDLRGTGNSYQIKDQKTGQPNW